MMECILVKYVAEVIFFFFKTGEAMLEPSMRLLIYQAACHLETTNGTHACNSMDLDDRDDLENGVQRSAAHYLLIYKMVMSFPSIFLGLFCGAWSDRIGRKLPIMLSSLGTIIGVLFYMVSILRKNSASFMPLILTGAVIRGIFGKAAVATMALHSYVTDTSDKEERTQRLGGLLSMSFFGFFFGSLTAGALLDLVGFDVIFCSVVFVNSICVIITMLFMKESVPGVTTILPKTPDVEEAPDLPPKNTSKLPFTLSNIKDSLQVLVEPRANNSRLHLWILFITIIVQQACKAGEVDLTLLLVQRKPLKWRPALYSYLLATDYLCLGIAVLLILPFFIKVIRLDDTCLVLIGIAFKTVRLLILSFSSQTWMVFMSVVVGCPSAMIISGVKSLISKIVREDEVGKTFSLLSCSETLSSFVGSIIFINVYAETLDFYPGFTLTIDAALFVLLFILVLCFAKDLRADMRRRDMNELISDDTIPDYGTTFITACMTEEESTETTSSDDTADLLPRDKK